MTTVNNRPGTVNVPRTATPVAPTPVAPATTPATTVTPAPAPTTPEAAFAGTTRGPANVPGAVAALGGAAAMGRLAAMAGAADPALLAALRTPEGLKATVENLSKALIASNGASITPAQEKKTFETLGRLQQAGQLRPALEMLAAQAQQGGALPKDMPAEKKAALITQFEGLVSAELDARGATNKPTHVFESWEAASKKQLEAVRNTAVPPKGPGNPSAFLDPRFVKEFETLTGAKFSEGNSVTPLIDGPASFKERDRLIEGAKTSIHMMTWAFYDDETGMETAKKLIAKHQQGVDVKIMVDGNVARQPGHDKMLKLMEDAGIPVVRWNDLDRVHDGQHRKAMVVDGKEAVAGGLNVGNVYSHRGPADAQKWRDTDVLLKGPAVGETHQLFASLSNEQVAMHNHPFGKVTVGTPPPVSGDARVSVVNDTPGPQGTSGALLAALKAIEGATGSVDIQNAYFISTPALREALLAALERGVKVRIMTNSAQSVDEPIVTAPILASLPELVASGAEVYLKQGDTLHSKLMVVDGLYAAVGSYNLHPRSERYEGEMLVNTLSKDTASNVVNAFEKDLAKATRVNAAADITVPTTAFSILASRFFFDQL